MQFCIAATDYHRTRYPGAASFAPNDGGTGDNENFGSSKKPPRGGLL